MTYRIVSILCVITWLLNGPTLALAQGFSGSEPQFSTPEPPRIDGNVGSATRALLAAQREGAYAGEAVPLRGEQALLAYKRYLNTFSLPMPEVSQGGTSSGGSR